MTRNQNTLSLALLGLVVSASALNADTTPSPMGALTLESSDAGSRWIESYAAAAPLPTSLVFESPLAKSVTTVSVAAVANFSFNPDTGDAEYDLMQSFGDITPVPEAPTWIVAGLTTLLVLWSARYHLAKRTLSLRLSSSTHTAPACP